MTIDSTLAYQQLQPDDILSSLDELGFRCDGRFLALNSYENRVYQVGIEDDEPVVAKFYRPARWSDAAIVEEHEFTVDLAAADLPVVAPIAIDGETLHRRGPFRLSVSPCRGGRAPELDDIELLKQLGRLVARIHLQGEMHAFQHRPTIDIESYGYSSSDFLLENDFVPEDVRESYCAIIEHLFDNVLASFERAGEFGMLRLHADFHPGNVLVDESTAHIVDFDDTRSGPAVQDLWMFLSGDRDEQASQISALLDGYQEFRRFDGRELNLIEALRSLRIVHYAAWLARRWDDPAFHTAFPWFNSARYWDEHILTLREQVALMQEEPLRWRDAY